MGRRKIPKIGDYTRNEVISFVKIKIRTDTKWAKRACVAIFNQQTPEEKACHLSQEHNSWGFSRDDTPILTRFARRIQKNRISDYEVNQLKRRIEKYAAQLVCLSEIKDGCLLLKRHLDEYYYSDQPNLF